eukprot:3297280-Rhodomonas_salina.1
MQRECGSLAARMRGRGGPTMSTPSPSHTSSMPACPKAMSQNSFTCSPRTQQVSAGQKETGGGRRGCGQSVHVGQETCDGACVSDNSWVHDDACASHRACARARVRVRESAGKLQREAAKGSGKGERADVQRGRTPSASRQSRRQ